MPLTVEFASELADWPDVDFVLAARSALRDHHREQFERLLFCWYVVGFYGGYGPPNVGRGVLHNMTEPSYDERDEGFRATWRADMGTAPDRALDVLVRALEGWSEDALPDATLTIR